MLSPRLAVARENRRDKTARSPGGARKGTGETGFSFARHSARKLLDGSFRPNEKLSTGGGFCFGDFEFFHGPDIFKLPASRDALFIPPPSPFPRCHFSLNIPRTFENFSPSLRMLPTKAGIFFRFFPNAISPASVCFVRPGQMSSVTVQAGVPYPPWLGIEASLLLTISSRISADTVRRRSSA